MCGVFGMLGERYRADFDRALRALLEPYAENDRVRYAVRTRVTWGFPKPRPAA